MSETFVYSTLKEKTIKLIETSLSYTKHYDYSVDFAPLMNEENLSCCHIVFIQETQEVIAHIGFLKKDLLINSRTYPVGLIGGVCVHEKYQGQGLFKKLFEKMVRFYGESVGVFMLWSEKVDLYKKFDFHLCIEQREIKKTTGTNQGFTQTKYYLLTDKEKMQIKRLYNEQILNQYSSFSRNEKDWRKVEEITSSDLYIKKVDDKIVGYFFMNKGQDLQGVIHEIALDSEHEDIYTYGNAWLGPNNNKGKEGELQFSSLVKVSNIDIFRRMIYDYTEQKVTLISLDKGEAKFEFERQIHSHPIDRFLTGIFGPYNFEEFNFKTKPLYISGLDSV